MLGRPRESGWLIRRYFQRKGDQGFFFLSGIRFIVKLRKMHCLMWGWQFQFAQGRACAPADSTQMHSGLFQGTQCWISSNPALRVCNWRLQRSGCEWIKAWINSECISFSRNAELSLSVHRPFIRWNLIIAFRLYQQHERQEINCLENIHQFCHGEYNLIVS